MLALRDDGVVIGSVSGGCIEDDLIDRVRREGLHYTKPEAVKYGISAEEAHRFGLPCGGTLQLVLEPLNASSGIDALLRAVEAGQQHLALVHRRIEDQVAIDVGVDDQVRRLRDDDLVVDD